MIAALLVLALLFGVGCCQESRHEPTLVKKFDPCMNGGRNQRPMVPPVTIEGNTVTEPVSGWLDHKCLSVLIESDHGQPTVLNGYIECRASGDADFPWYRFYNVVNPRLDHIAVPNVYQYRLTVDAWVTGKITWRPLVGDEWTRKDEEGWRWE